MNRATMDLDTTLKSLPLTPEAITGALHIVCAIESDDDVTFEVGSVTPIRDDDIYGGYRVMLNAILVSLHVINLIACVAWYCVGATKQRKN